MSRQRISQLFAVLFAVLITLSTVGGTVFVGAAGAASGQQFSQNSLPSSDSVGSDAPSSQPTPDTTGETQESLSDGNIQPQVAGYEPVNVSTTLESVDIEKFQEEQVGEGRYRLSGVIDANPSQPIAPVGHPVRLRLNVFELDADGDRNRVGTDTVQIFLEAGSVRPHKLNVNGTVIDLNQNHPNNTNPDAMGFKMYDVDGDGTDERVVMNGSGGVVLDVGGNPIINSDTDAEARAVRDPYTSKFEFITELGKNINYEYDMNFTASDGPTIKPIQTGTIDVTNAASATSVSSQYQVLKNTRWRNGSDVTFVTAYKSTTQQDQQEVYESLALPTRGEWRAQSLTPTGTVRGFAHASSNNGEFAEILPDTNGRFRITTSTQSVPANQPQTVVVRYVPPGDGELRMIPIDSNGVPIEAGRNAGNRYDDLGYELPADPTAKDYVEGGENARTNLAVIQLTPDEQKQLNQQGELFLSFESETTDSARIYCQAVLTGTIDRNSDACGINATEVDSFSNGVITDMTIQAVTPSFTGNHSDDNGVVYGLNPSTPDEVDVTVTVRNAGTQPITNEPVNLFENELIDNNTVNDSAQAPNLDIDVGTTVTRTLTLSDSFSGEDVHLRTDMDTGDGTLIVNVSNNQGDSEEFVYDGHQGLISERLDGMSPSDTWTVEIASEMATGQQEPEVNSVTIDGEVVQSKSMTEKTVTLGPGESTDVTWENVVPTTNTKVDQQITYRSHFYDDQSSVIAFSNVSGCDRSQNAVDCPEPTAIITGPSLISAEQTGSTLVREGTQTVRDTECPDGSGTTCGASSNWTLEEENVGTVSGTQTMTTTESGVPINESLTGTSTYNGNMLPLERGSIYYPYKNLPGDSSEWSVEGYETKDVVDSESILRTESQMIDAYGSLDAAYRAGWTITTRNVRTASPGFEYDHFRVLSGDTAINEGGAEIDVDSSEWSRVTREEYSHSDYSEPLTITKTTEVDTRIQQNNPGEGTLAEDASEWERRERVEKIVNRSYDAGIIEGYFHSSPGGAWEWNDTVSFGGAGGSCYTSAEGCRYTKPAIEEEYWTYEWVKLDDRQYRLHKKATDEDVHEWTRNYYKVEVEWSRSLSGTVNEYSGPQLAENENYDSAEAVFHGKKSIPSVKGSEITDYRWTINGEDVTPEQNNEDFTTGELTIISQNVIDLSESMDFALSNYEQNRNISLTDHHNDGINYQPFELTLDVSVDDRNEGSIQIRITNDKGVTKVHRVVGEDIPDDGQFSYNLAADSGFNSYSEYYKINVSGTANSGETVPAVQNIELRGNATRGSDTLPINTTTTGEMTIGLTVVDSQGLTDSTNRTIDITQYSPPGTGGGGGGGLGITGIGGCESYGTCTPSIVVTDWSREADYKLQNERASVTAQVSGLSGAQYYVVELVPGDIGVDAASDQVCGSNEEAMRGSQLKTEYTSWNGPSVLDIEDDSLYCVYTSDTSTGHIGVDGSTTEVYVEEAIQEDTTVKKVVWEGDETVGYSEQIHFTIDPKANSQITLKNNDFDLHLRRVGNDNPVDTAQFDIFFCHALNNDPDTRTVHPTNRETRETGGMMCPNLNSDFDQFNENTTVGAESFEVGDAATDGVDACPYDPDTATFRYAFEEEDEFNCKGQVPGRFFIEWTDFSDAPDDEQSRHIVYYDRYDAVGMDARDTTATTLTLGYSPRYSDNFKDDHLLGYYPLSEPSFSMLGIPRMDEAGSTTAWTTSEIGGGLTGVRDISTTLDGEEKAVVASPAWSLRQTDPTNIHDTYPYRNVWLAADLSGNHYHAPILHSQTQVQTESDTITRVGSIGGDYEYFWRGDTEKMLERGADGPYGTGAYRMSGESFFVPFKEESSRYQDHFNDGDAFDYGNCENSKCWLPRTDNSLSPIGGAGWNQGMASDLKDSDEFTISMYVKPGLRTGDGSGRNAWLQGHLNRTAFYEFQTWNGHQFGWFKDGQRTQNHVGYATGSFYAGAPQYNNINFWNRDEDTGAKYMHYGAPDHGGYAWPNLPSMVAQPSTNVADRTPLSPEYTGYKFGGEQNFQKQKAMAMSVGYKTISSPPRLKSLRATGYTTIQSNSGTGYGTGWRHLAITGDKDSTMTYYVDGLPYQTNVSTGDFSGWTSGAFDTVGYGEGASHFGGFQGSNLMHLVGAEATRATTGNYLQDWYISDYRIYNRAMTESQVNKRLVIDSGRYNSSTRNIENSERIKLPEDATMNMVLQETNASNMTIGIDGQLNGGAVNITAYPVNDAGERIDGGDQYIRVTHNETTSVNNTSFFNGTDVTGAELFDDLESKTYERCQYQSMTCPTDDPPELNGELEVESDVQFMATMSGNTVPDFVARDVLEALDNGTITSDTAYDILQHYDEQPRYLLNKRNFWQSSIHYSHGQEAQLRHIYYNPETNSMEYWFDYDNFGDGETILEQEKNIKWGITSVNRFENAVGYEKKWVTERENTLDVAEDERMYGEWEIVVRIEKRPHSQTGPQIYSVILATQEDVEGNLGCNEEIYRCE